MAHFDPSLRVSRRRALEAALVTGSAAALSGVAIAEEAAKVGKVAPPLTQKPPKGFVPMSVPGKIVKVSAKGAASGSMQPNQLWPKAEVAKRMLEKAMMEFTGASNLVEAMKRFVHKDDVVAIKPNGIAGQKGATMAVNFELILPVVEAVLALGVPPDKVMVYEQFPGFLAGCRVNVRQNKLPAGVLSGTHNNNDHPMSEIKVYQSVGTKYCRQFLDATCVIDMTQIKDHSICGYTGTMKNITHGNINNPHHHHAHNASPQIAMLYNHPIVTSRVRLHITDAFKVTYDKGPLDKDPNTRPLHGAVFVSTDPVAMDTIGWKLIDEIRKEKGLKSLKDAKREPSYIRVAGELGLGIHDLNAIRLKTFEV
jgi:uncharacterized protein (DUF362 family)